MRFLRVHEWQCQAHPGRSAGVNPMVFLNMFEDDAEAQGRRAAAELASRRPGDRVILPFWLLIKQIRKSIPEIPGRPDLDPMEIFERGIDPEPSIRWLTPLARELRQRGITLDHIVADVEDSVVLWAIEPEWSAEAWQRTVRRIHASKRAVERMPPELAQIKPEEYSPWTPEGRRAAMLFDAYSRMILWDAFRAVFIDSKLFHDDRGRQTFKLSNFHFLRPSFPVLYGNGWTLLDVAIDTVSAPALYLGDNAEIYQASPHEPAWSSFIHCLNIARSCLGRPEMEVIPWIGSPRLFVGRGGVEHDDRHRWLSGELMAHLVRSGIREFILWNADPDPQLGHRLTAGIFRRLDQPYRRAVLPELPLDVDRVETRGYTTRYSDYLASVGKQR